MLKSYCATMAFAYANNYESTGDLSMRVVGVPRLPKDDGSTEDLPMRVVGMRGEFVFQTQTMGLFTEFWRQDLLSKHFARYGLELVKIGKDPGTTATIFLLRLATSDDKQED
mmetsp:Transcript_21178/g.49905  ORF Transcript_21178/g.49905 Transcript_21178/m.49905 type:complete len:112 (+) Transcript_21178:400-735(+)